MILRSLRDSEWPEARALWETVFDPGCGWIMDSLDASLPGRSRDLTRVAEVDGRIVATVDVFIHALRGFDGEPVPVGCVGSVATLEAYRGRGLSGALIEQAIAEMARAECAWSYLFTGVPGHYARYGWFPAPTAVLRGEIAAVPLAPGVREIPVAEAPLAEMADLYAVFHARTPLAHVRDARAWGTTVPARLTREGNRLWGAFDGGSLTGYLVAAPGILREACGSPEALAALATAREGRTESRLGDDPRLAPLNSGLDEPDTLPWPMARPLTMPEPALRALLAAPGSWHSDLDGF